MSKNVSAIVIREHGEPERVAGRELIEVQPPAAGEVQVRMAFSPINPADLNVLEGKYPVRPELPGVPGVEGVGIVEAVGAGVSGWPAGAAALLPHRFGAWREAGNARAADLIAVPQGVPLEQAAMVRINPATALLMLREFVDLQPGEWILQNAGNSAVGQLVIQLARHFGWRTINVVRRPEVVEELKAAGADVVLVDGEQLGAEIKAAAGGAPIRLALNAVGGECALRMAGTLAPGGVVVTYGAMARQPLKIPNGLLIFQDLSWRGFWVTRWYESASAEARQALFAVLFGLLRDGVISTPIEAIYPLEQITEALAHAKQSRRKGKVLLRGA